MASGYHHIPDILICCCQQIQSNFNMGSKCQTYWRIHQDPLRRGLGIKCKMRPPHQTSLNYELSNGITNFNLLCFYSTVTCHYLNDFIGFRRVCSFKLLVARDLGEKLILLLIREIRCKIQSRHLAIMDHSFFLTLHY